MRASELALRNVETPIGAVLRIEVGASVRYLLHGMNSQLIRQRLNMETKPFVFRLSDGTRVPVAHPDFVAVSFGQVVVINPKTEGLTRIDPSHLVAIEEAPPKKSKSNGKHTR